MAMLGDPESETIYTVVCTDAQDYAHWQCELLEHTWHAVGQPGELVRLVAAAEDEPLPEHDRARVVRTAPSNVHPVTRDRYVPYNRLFSNGSRPSSRQAPSWWSTLTMCSAHRLTWW